LTDVSSIAESMTFQSNSFVSTLAVPCDARTPGNLTDASSEDSAMQFEIEDDWAHTAGETCTLSKATAEDTGIARREEDEKYGVSASPAEPSNENFDTDDMYACLFGEDIERIHNRKWRLYVYNTSPQDTRDAMCGVECGEHAESRGRLVLTVTVRLQGISDEDYIRDILRDLKAILERGEVGHWCYGDNSYIESY
jgi:hypothetical protein